MTPATITTAQQQYLDAFAALYEAADALNAGDPMSYARSREIHLACLLCRKQEYGEAAGVATTARARAPCARTVAAMRREPAVAVADRAAIQAMVEGWRATKANAAASVTMPAASTIACHAQV